MTYRFYRKDFGELELKPLHYDLLFDVAPKKVRVIAKQTYLYDGASPTSELKLNSHDLSIEGVRLFKTHSKLGKPPVGLGAKVPDFVKHVASLGDPVDVKYEVKKEDRFLIVLLPKAISKGDEVAIETTSVCFPTDNILEGIYYDYTAEGCPQQMITQCQQYGFQRIVPCVDRMASKTFYTTTIVADKNYPSLITNGDLAPGFVDPATNETIFQTIKQCLPTFTSDYEGPERKVVKYYNHKVNMAPYLFFLGCGTYEVFKRQVEYPDGDTFMLELLSLPGIAEEKGANEALEALHNCILWVYLSTGPEATQHNAERARQYELIERREQLKSKAKLDSKETQELVKVRTELAANDKKWGVTGYKYTGSVYREIGMENSNYGGMENVGNTTIISSKLCPTKWLVDPGYVYMEGVKVHEYYHNINGSQVTGQSPFEIWLNEAVTVYVQRQYEDHLFGADYMRLKKVEYAFSPGNGPLAEDRKPNSLAVEPAGFNTTHELISAMTYSKAPEFVRMVRLVLGTENFNKALHNYHSKYAYANAKTEDWIQCMSELAPKTVDLHKMAQGWLKRTGYPTLHVKKVEYDTKKKQLVLNLKQTGFENHKEDEQYPWIIPVDYGLVTDGASTNNGLFIMTETEQVLTINDVAKEPQFVSVARSWSFFGDVNNEASTKEMVVSQAMEDPDVVNRYLAFRTIVDDLKADIINATMAKKVAEPDPKYIELYGIMLTDPKLSPILKAFMLSVPESISSYPEHQHRYIEVAAACKALKKQVYGTHGKQILAMYDDLVKKTKPGPQKDGLLERALKNHLLGMLSHGLEKKEFVARLKAQLQSPFMSDKIIAFRHALEVPLPEIIEPVKKEWAQHPIGIENYILAIATSDCDQTPEYIRALMKEPFFNLSLAGHARTVARGWANNRKRSLLSDAGLDLTVELCLTIGKVNEMSAYSILSAFGDLEKFEGEEQARLVNALKRMKDGLDKDEQQSLFNQLSTILEKFVSIEEAHQNLPVIE